jgi:hypothetical protein
MQEFGGMIVALGALIFTALVMFFALGRGGGQPPTG